MRSGRNPAPHFTNPKHFKTMDDKMIGFVYYISERNCPIDKSNTEAYAKWIRKMYKVYCAKYPNGLTNGDKLMFN